MSTPFSMCFHGSYFFAFFLVEWDLQKIAHKIVTHVNMHVVLQTVVFMKHVAATLAILRNSCQNLMTYPFS